MTSDYSSFEASHRSKVVRAIFGPIYRKAFGGFDDCEQIVSMLLDMIANPKKQTFFRNDKIRRMVFKDMESIEMSGDPTTALNNYVFNLVAYVDVYLEKGAELDIIFASLLLEGDDDVNDPLDYEFTKEDFAKRGLICKIVKNLDFEEAGLCQMFFTPESDVINANAVKKMLSTTHIPKKYIKAGSKTHRSLLAGHARCLLSDHKGAPIVHAWGRALLRLTSGQNVRDSHWKEMGYHANIKAAKELKWEEVMKIEVTLENRLVVERVFGISVARQEMIEDQIDNWEGGELHLPLCLFPQEWVDFHNNYVRTCDMGELPVGGSRSEVSLKLAAWVKTL
jgi:hypothetical protein